MLGRPKSKCVTTEGREEICITRKKVENVGSFKYLGTVIDRNLAFRENSDHVHKKSTATIISSQEIEKFQLQSLHAGISLPWCNKKCS